MANGTCADVFDSVSILICNKVSISRPSPYKQKPILESTVVFKKLKKYWDEKVWDSILDSWKLILPANSKDFGTLIFGWLLVHLPFKISVLRENI